MTDAQAAAAGLTLLNVDDTEAGRYAKTRALEAAGFRVAEAVNGREALALVEALSPALVLLDVKLPDISGIEVCRRIKRDHPEIMVLQISASYVQAGDKILGLESGADVYLTQPIEGAELAAAVRALLRLRAAEHALRQANETLESRVLARTEELATTNAQLRREMEERERAEAALVQAQKMEAVGQLTGGIAHDFNNLLTAVIGGLDLIVTRTAEPRTRKLAGNALEAARRGAKLTGQLLTFSRIQKLVPSPVEVNALVAGMRELVEQSIGPAHQLVVTSSAAPAWVRVDGHQLELTVLNLVINARDASAAGGAIRLEVEAQAGDPVCIAVSDSGAGMTPEVKARAFDPFFTTKGPGKGTGLGLSQVFGFMQQSGGEVRIDSAPGAGTTVVLTLPATSAGTAETSAEPKPQPRAADKRILVVDDDAHVRDFVCEALSDAGYEVVCTSSGADGLVALCAGGVDLALLDYAMPDMSGADLVVAARRDGDRTPVLFVTGFADTARLHLAAPDADILRKPFDVPTLLDRVRDLTRGEA